MDKAGVDEDCCDKRPDPALLDILKAENEITLNTRWIQSPSLKGYQNTS